jgi:hypothetical protein
MRGAFYAAKHAGSGDAIVGQRESTQFSSLARKKLL